MPLKEQEKQVLNLETWGLYINGLISCPVTSEGGQRAQAMVDEDEPYTEPDQTVKGSLWQTHWSKSHCNPQLLSSPWCVPAEAFPYIWTPVFHITLSFPALSVHKAWEWVHGAVCALLRGQEQHRLLKLHVYLQMASCPLPLTTANFQAEPFAQIRHSRDQQDPLIYCGLAGGWAAQIFSHGLEGRFMMYKRGSFLKKKKKRHLVLILKTLKTPPQNSGMWNRMVHVISALQLPWDELLKEMLSMASPGEMGGMRHHQQQMKHRQTWPAERTASKNAGESWGKPAGHGEGRNGDPANTLCLFSLCWLPGTKTRYHSHRFTAFILCNSWIYCL